MGPGHRTAGSSPGDGALRPGWPLKQRTGTAFATIANFETVASEFGASASCQVSSSLPSSLYVSLKKHILEYTSSQSKFMTPKTSRSSSAQDRNQAHDTSFSKRLGLDLNGRPARWLLRRGCHRWSRQCLLHTRLAVYMKSRRAVAFCTFENMLRLACMCNKEAVQLPQLASVSG